MAKLPDRSSFAGSMATCAVLLKKCVTHYHINLADAVYMLTQVPAKIMHIKNKGAVRDGFSADLVMFDKNLKINKVILNGDAVS